MNEMNVMIIDCTIRDGGHITKWKFDDHLVKASYFAAQNGHVDYFEIGYKNDLSREGLGPYGYCDNSYISDLFKHSKDVKLLCMLDAGKYTGYEIVERSALGNPFAGIRIAAYPHEVDIAISLAEELHKKGYEVFINLMASAEWSDEQLMILKCWKNKDILEAIYFADSFGSYGPSEITAYIKKLKGLGFKRIGFHGHNNLQMAFANTLQALNDGAVFIDASIYGMGRGAGNLPIEILLSYLNKQGQAKYNVVPYLDVIERFYIGLFKKHPWGYSLNSLLGGIRDIHPYYVEELFHTHNYTIEDIWNILETIKEKCPVSFSGEKLKTTILDRLYVPLTSNQAQKAVKEIERQSTVIPAADSFLLKQVSIINKHKNGKFLIIANGPSVYKYQDQIKKLIESDGLITIGCNFLQGIYDPNYHIFVSKKRFLKYAQTISTKSILLVPSFFGKRLVKENFNGEVEYIQIDPVGDLSLEPINGVSQRIVYLNVAIAAILSAYQMGAKDIMIVGMDGYQEQAPGEIVYFYNEEDKVEDKLISSIRYENVTRELSRVADFLSTGGIPLSIITPTSHKKHYKSIIQ